ncbi:putative transcription factor, eukaryotic MBF1 -like protein [Thermoplasmatales archaeon BRNA1]|nr:putative transcription factor, eukaryotic MBF1 -like protein [Thermoplasmatales archaeon BRNA1]
MSERTKSTCEMCGKACPTRPFVVQGVRMNLCPNCAKFGDDYRPPRGAGEDFTPGSNNAVIQQRLEKREKRMQTKDIYAGTANIALVDDYGTRIRQAREKKGLSCKDFAASIGEKEMTISKYESQRLTPDDKMIAKLEKALNIKLTELVQDGKVSGSGQASQGMTLGNFIIYEDKKN